ncbi:MAG: hypothetical protein SFU27_08750 [Thermonemataceae bacterium]|nr:hypothetical protein [Thermonemataceae bacterium]
MKNLKILFLLSLGLLTNACKLLYGNRDECERIENGIDDAMIRFAFGFQSNYDFDSFMAYDEDWEPAAWDPGTSWKPAYPFGGEYYIFYADSLKTGEPYQVDKTKNFYIAFSKGEDVVDVDTLRLEYKILNRCRNMEYMRAYYNNESIYDVGHSISAYHGFGIKKK